MEAGFIALQQLPCAGCRALHRKCSSNCTLAPYFPADEPDKFVSVHKVFGASNVIKMLQIVDEAQREDAAKSMVYEAYARLRDPVHGCTNTISYLLNCVAELEKQLNATNEQVLQHQNQRDQLLRMLMDATCLGFGVSVDTIDDS